MTGMYESVPASPDEVETYGKSLTPAYLHCRVWGHDPVPHNIVVAKDIEGVPRAHWDATLTCSHGCGVRWTVLASVSGEVLRRKLDYSGAPGYISEAGRIGAEGRQILRKQFFTGATKRSRKKASR